MATDYTVKNITEITDVAADRSPNGEAQVRFAGADLDATDTGFAHHRYAPGIRQPFGHRHEQAEEVYVVIDGSGRVKLDDDVIEIGRLDAIRVAPGVTRAFEAGDEGLEYLAFGPRFDSDGEIVPGWWAD
jgi:mannose-6-phosphate isomerase-like protein (cupin superfamily)